MKVLKLCLLMMLSFSLFHCAPVRPTHKPPPPPMVKRTPRPGPNYIWIQGRHVWKNGRWHWVRGHWTKNRPGKVWVKGHWVKRGNRWVWIKGHWRRK
jgi:hypothetical protein